MVRSADAMSLTSSGASSVRLKSPRLTLSSMKAFCKLIALSYCRQVSIGPIQVDRLTEPIPPDGDKLRRVTLTRYSDIAGDKIRALQFF